MGKKNRIILPGEDNFQQSSLFIPSFSNDFFPPVRRTYEEFKRILHSSRSYLGVDYEFPPSYKASIVGISSLDECAAIPASPEIVREVIETTRSRGVKRVGHSVLGAEVRVEEVTTGLNISPDEYDDSMLSHFLLNQDLAKAPDKKEEDDAGALGFMGLWPCCSMVLDLPYWKNHRGADCSSDICPTCDVFGYCAVDAYGSIASFVKHLSLFDKVGLSRNVYEEFKELTYIAELMHRRGIKVDMEWVKKLEKEAETIKEKMFPFELVNGKPIYNLFNPKSNQQVLEWFHSKKINLEDTTKKTILKALEKEANKYGFNLRDEDGKLSLHELQINDELPEVLDALYREYEYKSSGKGLAPWFDSKYRDSDDYIHPRFITVGASTTRWSSSKPNFQNIPARGFGALVRAAIICSRLGNTIVKSDFSQLEARICLYLGGFDHTIIGKDLFTWLVQNSNGAFEKAAQELGDKPRQVAKSLAHGCLTPGHEILTERGWINIENWKNEKIAVWTETGSIYFDFPTKYHVYDVDEKLIEIKGRGFNAVCTNNHTWPENITGNWKNKKYNYLRKIETKDLKKSGRIAINGYLFNPKNDYKILDIQKIVAIQADAKIYNGRAHFHVVKNRKKERLFELFNIPQKPCGCHNGGITFSCDIPAIDLLNNKKQFTYSLLMLTKEQREKFLEEITFWDGNIRKDGNRKIYLNTDKQSVDIVQTLAHISGLQSLVRNIGPGELGTKDVYSVSFNKRKYASINRLNFIEKNYKGKVYCFTTNTGYFLIRYNNTIMVSGNSNYLEGIVLLKPYELNKPDVKKAIEFGSLRIYRDWEWRGKIVGFTGSNLADRLFGSHSGANRKRALDLLEDLYFANVPLRQWQKKELEKIENNKYIKFPTGHMIALHDRDEEEAKLCVAALGQGVSAQFVQERQLEFYRTYGKERGVPMLQVHDELDFEVPGEWSDKKVADFMSIMGEESKRLPGFKGVYKTIRGTNWLEWDPKVDIPGSMKPLELDK